MTGTRMAWRIACAGAMGLLMWAALVTPAGAVLIGATSGKLIGATSGTTSGTTTQSTITLAAKHHGIVSFGSSASLSGTVTSQGAAVPGAQVILQAKPFPYDKAFTRVAATRTDKDGNYAFTPSPTHNTMYRVALGSDLSQRSPTLTSFVTATYAKCVVHSHSTTVKASCVMTYPKDVKEDGHDSYWYFALNHAKRAGYVERDPLPKPKKPGRMHLTHVFTVPAGWKYANFWVFTRDLPGEGLGFKSCLDPVGNWAGGHKSCKPPASVRTRNGKP